MDERGTADPGPARAEGGPCDGEELGPATPTEYEVRTADRAVHVYVRSHRSGDGTVYRYAGRR